MTKKEREYNVVAPLFKEYGFTPVKRQDDERPDFVVCNKQGIVVGIEVTDVRDKSKAQIEATEKAFDQLLQKYCSQRKEGPKALFSVAVNQSYLHNGLIINDVEERIFEELDKIVEQKSKTGKFVQYFSDYPSTVFSVSRMPGHFTYETTLPIELLRNTIEEKNKKLRQYVELQQNAGIREYWLVINVPMKEGWDYSAFQGKEFLTGYSRIYLTNPFSMNRLV